MALAIVTLVCIFTACKNQTPTDDISTTSSTIAETKESITEESTTAENSTQENTTEQTEELGQSEKSTEVQTERKTESTTTSHSNPTTTQKSKETETKKETTTRQTPPSTTKVPETTTQKPTTTQPTTKAQTIDIDYYVNYATNYGKSIGLKYLSNANECWDTPIIIASDNHDAAIRDIKRRLERYKNVDGDEYFCVWAEKRSDDRYELFIGYA